MKPDKNLPNWGGLLSVLEGRDPKMGAEVGVWTGRNSASLLDAFPDLELVAIDPYDDQFPHKNKTPFEEVERQAVARLAPYWKRVRWLKLHSVEACRLFPDEYFDFVFIDADHRYKSIKEDIMGWMLTVKKGGILAGHDYKHPGKRHAGVKKAVDEIFGDGVNVIPWPCTVWWIER